MTRYEELAQPLEKKGIDATIEKMKKDQDDLYGSNSEFLYYFDLGCLNHYKRNFKESAANFAKAEQIYEDLYTKSVTNEAAAIVTNDNTRPYRARPFELLLMYEFQILNYLAMMDLDGAMVEVRRSQIAMNALYQKIAYINTVKAYKEGKLKVPNEVLEFVTEGLRHADREDDLKSLGTPIPGITPKASSIRENGQEIIVIGYAGHSPILGELYMSGTFISGGVMNLTYKDGETGRISTFTLVAPPVAGAGTGESVRIGFSLPEIRKRKNGVDHFEVSLDGSPRIRPEKVMAVDEELKQNMEDEKSSTVTRTAVRVILRTIAAQKAKQAMKTDNILLNLLTSIGTDVAQSQIEQADLRVGLFMPHSLHMTRIPVTPGQHKVVVTANGSAGETVELFEFDKLNVAKGQKVFLIVPSIR